MRAGDTITWVNGDPVDHDVIFRRNGPQSRYLAAGDTFSATLPAGEYDYACSLHKGMVGRVIVTAR